MRRAFWHEHEECGDAPIDPQCVCDPDLFAVNLARMGLGAKPSFIWRGESVLPPNVDLTNVMSVAAPGCNISRSYHVSTAIDVLSCSPPNSPVLWEALYSGMS